MGKQYDVINDRLRTFVTSQPVYFVATAPESGGHVNVSPKGYADTFAVLDDTTVAYLDLDGSGVETISHLRNNGRITIMFAAFSGSPNIVRLYGTGEVVIPDDPRFEALLKNFGPHPAVRSVIVVSCDRITDSCGYSVPFMEYEKDRPLLDDHHELASSKKRLAERSGAARESIDGLFALHAGETDPANRHS
ncbi:pyridoxamine 5'-phosphate oxidase family protein [Herbidospora mongoliensis]|uniref:pyridoxamine 5'-phosphate oxidase family protein n=1 Tax=Herbidospora mongoliensis TaxID=688067 RepID=UPI00082B8A84|nr:pyridoxamine 5'-phosphate oxidase family protein [Herbidospora mongoliensis]